MDTLEIAKKMREVVRRRPVMPGKLIGHNELCDVEVWHLDYLDQIAVVKSVASVECVGSLLGGLIQRVDYEYQGQERVMFLLPIRGDIDSFAEESIVYARGDEPQTPDEIADAFIIARNAKRKHNKEVLRDLEELDSLVPIGFRSILFSYRSQQVAQNMYEARGVLSKAVFAPYRHTAAYPESDAAAQSYFERFCSPHVTKDAYMAVGKLLSEKNL
jgi:hypothetical protein